MMLISPTGISISAHQIYMSRQLETSTISDNQYNYLDNLNGRISYLLAISYHRETEEEVSIFLELNSRLVLEGLGYPGLLVDESLLPEQINYSYAKYVNKHLADPLLFPLQI